MSHMEYIIVCVSRRENLRVVSTRLEYSEVSKRIQDFSRGRLLYDGDKIEVSIERKLVKDQELEFESESI